MTERATLIFFSLVQGFLTTLVTILVTWWFLRRRRLRTLADRFVALTRERRAEIDAAWDAHDRGDVATETPSVPVRSTHVNTKEKISGGTVPPGAQVARPSLFRDNGRFTNGGQREG